MNIALPYQDLAIMDACLAAGVSYLDTANYEPPDEAHFEYSWQWAYREKFEKAGLTAILGCGFDPGVTQVFSAYAQKHYFDTIETLDILDCRRASSISPTRVYVACTTSPRKLPVKADTPPAASSPVTATNTQAL